MQVTTGYSFKRADAYSIYVEERTDFGSSSVFCSMRSNEIRLSDTEKNQLHNYKTEEFDETVPYGFIIGRLLDEVEA